MTSEELKISWLHCNVCHRAFENHNQINLNGEQITLIHSDLSFYFTGCGHFFCENCLHSENENGFSRPKPGGNSNTIKCRMCGDLTQGFKMQSIIPEKVAVYLRPPINLLEDSLSIMMFQLNNANNLILALRSKITHQKDLLNRAKSELSMMKELQEKVKILENREKIHNFTSNIPNTNIKDNNKSTIFPSNQNHFNYPQIDPNETFKIPIEFQHSTNNNNNNHMRPKGNNSALVTNSNTVQFSPNPFTPSMQQKGIVYSNLNNHNPSRNINTNSNNYNSHKNYNYTSNNRQNQANFIPPDSPVIHAHGRLSLKSPSISSQINNFLPSSSRRYRK